MKNCALAPGMLIKTNYSGPYRIKAIKRGCTCPSYLETGNIQPHLHIACSCPKGTGHYSLNHFDETTLFSLYKTYCGGKNKLGFDHIIILDQDIPIQISLFDMIGSSGRQVCTEI